MESVKINDVPIYEVTCEECKSVIRYKACEVAFCHITCPVCGVSLWANTICPVAYEPLKKIRCQDICKHAPPGNKWPCIDCDMRFHDRAEPKEVRKKEVKP